MTLVNVEMIADDKILIAPEDQYREKELIKLVPGAAFHPETRTWRVPLSWPACHALRGVFGERLNIGPKLGAWATEELERWVVPGLTLRGQTDAPGDPNEYPHQRVGTAWLKLVRYGLIADEMRTGKTVQACVALRDLHAAGQLAQPALIVCPNGVKRVWERHLAQWAPELRVAVVKGSALKRRKILAGLESGDLDVVIYHWEGLHLHSRLSAFGSIALNDKERREGELNRKWSVVIADEAHRAKAPQSKQTRALWSCSAQSEYRWAFTGTPVANAPDDLWSILHFLNPTEWPGKTRYIDRYCQVAWNPWGSLDVVGLNPGTADELRKSLDARMLRRTQREVWDEVPDVVYEPRYVDLSTREQKNYDHMRDDLLVQLDSGQVVGWNPLTQLTRLLQFASASLEEIPGGKTCPDCKGFGLTQEQPVCVRCQGTGKVEAFKLCEPSAKLDEWEDLYVDLKGQPFITASPSRQLLQLLEARLIKRKIPFASIHGEVSQDERDRGIDLFQSGKIDVILLQTAAGSEGIDLSRASTTVFLNRSWSLINNDQTEARMASPHKGAAKLTVIDLITNDTAEDRVFDALVEKHQRLQEILRDGERLRGLLTKMG